jgi:hypothetical protein
MFTTLSYVTVVAGSAPSWRVAEPSKATPMDRLPSRAALYRVKASRSVMWTSWSTVTVTDGSDRVPGMRIWQYGSSPARASEALNG